MFAKAPRIRFVIVFQLLNTAIAGKINRQRQLKHSAEPVVPFRPKSAEPRIEGFNLHSAGPMQMSAALEYLAPNRQNDFQDRSDSRDEIASEQLAPPPVQQRRAVSAQPQSERIERENRRLKSRNDGPRWIQPKKTTGSRPRRSPQRADSTAPRTAPERTAIDEYYDAYGKTAAEEDDDGVLELLTSNQQRNSSSLPRRSVPSRTQPVRPPLYEESEPSESERSWGREHQNGTAVEVVEKITGFRDDLTSLYDAVNQLNTELLTEQLGSPEDDEDDRSIQSFHREHVSNRGASSPLNRSYERQLGRKVVLAASRQLSESDADEDPAEVARANVIADTRWVLAKHGVAIEGVVTLPEAPARRQQMLRLPLPVSVPDASIGKPSRRNVRGK